MLWNCRNDILYLAVNFCLKNIFNLFIYVNQFGKLEVWNGNKRQKRLRFNFVKCYLNAVLIYQPFAWNVFDNTYFDFLDSDFSITSSSCLVYASAKKGIVIIKYSICPSVRLSV